MYSLQSLLTTLSPPCSNAWTIGDVNGSFSILSLTSWKKANLLVFDQKKQWLTTSHELGLHKANKHIWIWTKLYCSNRYLNLLLLLIMSFMTPVATYLSIVNAHDAWHVNEVVLHLHQNYIHYIYIIPIPVSSFSEYSAVSMLACLLNEDPNGCWPDVRT